jgi:hypothetical protein
MHSVGSQPVLDVLISLLYAMKVLQRIRHCNTHYNELRTLILLEVFTSKRACARSAHKTASLNYITMNEFVNTNFVVYNAMMIRRLG